MKVTSIELGREAETFAAKMLMDNGLHLIEKNVNFRVGELDLIMKDKDSLVFVEVKRRKQNKFGGALESITAVKKKRLTRAALAYLQRKKLMDKVACRFDLVAVTDTNGQLTAQWIKNTF